MGVLVFNTAQGWPEQFSAALRAEATAAHTGVVEITIPDLPAGDYAVVALHDENANKQLDRNWLGVPVEQWGMSKIDDTGLRHLRLSRRDSGWSRICASGSCCISDG